MKTIHARLRLSTNLDGSTRERCPDVVFFQGETQIAEIRTDVEQPVLALGDGEIDELVIHDDALSRVIDEEAWLQEFARVIAMNGRLRFTLPAEGILAWLDTMNAHRYITDITSRGHAPDAANPTGWNRHYSRGNIERLVTDAGFEAREIHGQSHVRQEATLLTQMLWRNWIREDRTAELELFPRFGKRSPDGRSGLIVTTWSVSTRKRQT